jgi:cob(I)alamin adenosyltransferase
MGNRITRVYTRTGDDGTTATVDGARIPKHAPLVAAIGDVDELNAVVGLLRAEQPESDLDERLELVQHDLFSYGGELSMPEFQQLSEVHVGALEAEIDRLNEGLPPLKEFILPAGSRQVALCHQARVVCRRAERGVSGLSPHPRAVLMQYINRLSDYFFVLAREIARRQGNPEVYWRS